MSRRPLIQLLLAVAVASSMAACATAGGSHVAGLQAAGVDELLQPGHTTRAEAERLLGAGEALCFSSGWSTVHYIYRQGLPRALDFVPVIGLVASAIETSETELVLLFDADGVLRKFKLRRSS
ncbi:hypothetical protein [Pelomonas cellulosilytica]|uniref:Lipoprotein SmpA/OmlA domain-containing protein n=1 Tax=Pelomonas cellulosilytica TaxID=2906762 RepID=A0ABS8XQR2_9BURK|nr:hypothetical protein [Pelomonas sp. P8]MCE4553186.1 hypothetical protein [Pelomonas sp. P8]